MPSRLDRLQCSLLRGRWELEELLVHRVDEPRGYHPVTDRLGEGQSEAEADAHVSIVSVEHASAARNSRVAIAARRPDLDNPDLGPR